MASRKEYSKLSTDEHQFYSPSLDATHDYLCQRCSASIGGVKDIPGRKTFTKASIFQVCMYALLLTANVGTIALVWLRTTPVVTDCVRPVLTFSLAKADGALSYEKLKLITDIDANVYAGPPRPVHEEAWAHAVQPMTIKISNDEMKLLDEEYSIKFADGSGYIAEPTVYHELHCIKRIRRHLHMDHYYPNMTAIERYRENIHMDHCLEYWREAAMCHGDTSIVGYYWRNGLPVSHVRSVRECVNWENLDSWARSRMVDMSDLSVFVLNEPSN